MPVAPDRSTAQRLEALRRANVIRSRRKELKAELKARGVAELVRLLLAPDRVARELVPGAPAGYVDTMTVAAALVAARGIGTVKAGRLLRSAKVSPSKTLAGMTRRQREDLVELVRPMRRLRSAQPITTTRQEAAR